MKFTWSSFIAYIKGNASQASLEHQVFNIACFCSAGLNLLAALINPFLDVHPTNYILPIFAFGIYAGLFWKSRSESNYKPLHLIYVVVTQSYLSFFWFYNAGSDGVMLIIMLAAFSMYLAAAPYSLFKYIIPFMIVNVSVLYYTEYVHPEWVAYYGSIASRMFDLAFITNFVIIGLSICIYLFKKSFDEERSRNERSSLALAEAKSEIKIKKIIENSTDAVITTDIEGLILEWNQAASRTFGYHIADAKGKNIGEIIIPDSVKESFNQAILYFKEKTNFIRFETAAINNVGEIFPVELSMTQIEYEDKVLLNFFIRNIKERKENEEKILKKNQQLQELNQEMDAFIYRASHDLRTPATNISGLLEIYNNSSDSEKDEIALKLRSNNEKMLKMLEDLSDYSRNHRTDLSYHLIKLDEITENIKKGLAHLPDAKRLVIQIEETGNHIFISDYDRLHIVLLNLIENSVCFNNPDNEEILVKIMVVKASDKVVIKVSDNGEGIKEDTLPKIFNMFFRGSLKSIGAGLGLYIVKRIISKMKGSIEVSSIKGLGTTFTIEIPNKADFFADSSNDSVLSSPFVISAVGETFSGSTPTTYSKIID